MSKISLSTTKIFQKMLSKAHSSLLFLFLGLFGLVACVDIPDFDDTPRIEFNSITKETGEETTPLGTQIVDKVTVTIDFEDGDGDLGITNAQSEDPIYTNSGWGNYQLLTYVMQPDGSFEEIDLVEDRIMFFPVLKPDGVAGPIKGKLDLHQTRYHTNFSKPTVVKYRVKIRDRAMNVSNEIETDTISVMLDM